MENQFTNIRFVWVIFVFWEGYFNKKKVQSNFIPSNKYQSKC
jgi:hypothetical protein